MIECLGFIFILDVITALWLCKREKALSLERRTMKYLQVKYKVVYKILQEKKKG